MDLWGSMQEGAMEDDYESSAEFEKLSDDEKCLVRRLIAAQTA